MITNLMQQPAQMNPVPTVYQGMDVHTGPSVRLSEKLTLTIKEAAAYSGIGENTLIGLHRRPKCPFALYVGKKRMIKREAFEKYISEQTYLR